MRTISVFMKIVAARKPFEPGWSKVSVISGDVKTRIDFKVTKTREFKSGNVLLSYVPKIE